MDNTIIIDYVKKINSLEEEIKKLKEKILIYEKSTKLDYEKIIRLKSLIHEDTDYIDFLDSKYN